VDEIEKQAHAAFVAAFRDELNGSTPEDWRAVLDADK
jgi:hypothetical protein